MPDTRGRRIYRATTAEERARHAAARQAIANELPEIREHARATLDILKQQGTPIRQLISAMKAERERQGLSLADIKDRTGIDRAALSRLENNEEANPTLSTLERYADAIGKHMVVVLTDSSIGSA